MINIGDSRTPEHIELLVDIISTNKYDEQIMENFNTIIKNNKYTNGIRFYFNIYSNTFVNRPSPGFTFLRTIIDRRDDDNYTIDYIKPYIEQSLEKYYNDVLSDDVNFKSLFSSGMVTYLDLQTEDVLQIVFRNMEQYSPALLTLIDPDIDINDLVNTYNINLTSNKLSLLKRHININKFDYSLDSFMNKFKSNSLNYEDISKFKSYVELIKFKNDYASMDLILDNIEGVDIASLKNVDEFLSIISKLPNYFFDCYEVHTNDINSIRLLVTYVYLYSYNSKYNFRMMNYNKTYMNFKDVDVFVPKFIKDKIFEYQSAINSIVKVSSTNLSDRDYYDNDFKNDLLHKINIDSLLIFDETYKNFINRNSDDFIFYKMLRRAN